MQDDPPQDELDASQSESSDDDGSDATEISEAETEKPNAGEADSNGVEEPSKSLVLGDSLAGVLPSDASGIIEDEIKSTDVGSSESEIHYGTKRFLQGFFPFAECWFSGGVEAWDVDLGEFLNDVEDDPNAATMLGTTKEFDLDAGLEDDIIEDAFYSKNPPDDDDMFCDSNPEQDSLRENPLVADISSYTSYDESDEAPCKLYIRKLLGKCLVPFVIIFLLILISMILYGYVCWIKSMMH